MPVILQLLATYGLPAVVKLVQTWRRQEPANPTAKEWSDVLVEISKDYDAYIAEAQAKSST